MQKDSSAKQIKPQKGFQTQFLNCKADIAIGGGAAGVGKTFAELLESLRFSGKPNFGAVFFRRTTPQIRSEGGLWDASTKLFTELQQPPIPSSQSLTWRFASGAKIQFRHLQREDDRFSYQGTEIPLILFDELTHFTKKQFFYLLSRNRSTCGVKPYVRATCNPQGRGWVKDLVQWWIYPDDHKVETLRGLPIPERAGKLRYMIKDGEAYVWGDTPEDVIQKCPHIFQGKALSQKLEGIGADMTSMIKSVSFIPGSIYDNKELLGNDPGYLGNLMSQDEEDKMRLLNGCWMESNDENKLYQWPDIQSLWTNSYVKGGKRYITADVALEGSDSFVIGVWEGWRLVDIYNVEKSDGKQVLEQLKRIREKWRVPAKQICYDHDGVGGFIKGFLRGSIGFQGNARAEEIKQNSGKKKENYYNLRSQCFFRLRDIIEAGEMFIATDKYKDLIQAELDSIKKMPVDSNEKLRIIPKSQIKTILGRSTDFADMIMMRCRFDLMERKNKVFAI